MADYDALTYWRLTGRYNGIVGDTTGTWGDADNRPDLFNAEIPVTLNLHVAGQRGVPELRLPGVTPPRTILLIPVDARIESGVLRLPGAPAGVDGVELVAKSTAMGLDDTPLLCTAEFGRTTIGGRLYQFAPVTFVVPTVEPAAYAAGRVQIITILGAPTAGAWQLYYDNLPTTGLPPVPTAGAVQAALRALAPIGTNVDVVGPDGGPFTATFTGPLGAGNPSPLVPVSTLTGGTAPKVVVTDAYTPVTLDLTTVERVDTPPSTPAELVVRMIPDDYHLTDTTLVFSAGGTDFGDGVDLAGVVGPRVTQVTSEAAPVIDVAATDVLDITALAVDVTGVTTTGTPRPWQPLWVSITAAAERTVVWDAGDFADSGTAAWPTVVPAGQTVTAAGRWNPALGRFVCFAADAAGY